jgi:hypothetical protein
MNTTVEKIKTDPPSNLKVIHDVGMEFLIYSQTIHEYWNSMHLCTKCYECEDRIFIRKHPFALRKVVDKDLIYLNHIFTMEEVRFLNKFDEVGGGDCREPLHEECPQLYGHKGDPRATPRSCGAMSDMDQMILK